MSNFVRQIMEQDQDVNIDVSIFEAASEDLNHNTQRPSDVFFPEQHEKDTLEERSGTIRKPLKLDKGKMKRNDEIFTKTDNKLKIKIDMNKMHMLQEVPEASLMKSNDEAEDDAISNMFSRKVRKRSVLSKKDGESKMKLIKEVTITMEELLKLLVKLQTALQDDSQ